MNPIVVIGGGTAGCTVVSQLAAMTSRDIILLESGESSLLDDEPRFMDVLDENNAPEFAMVSLVEGCIGVPYIQAKSLGGGSALNAMLLTGEPPPSVEGLTSFPKFDELGSISQALLAHGGAISRMWWNVGRWNPGRAVQHLAKSGRISIVQQDAVRIGHSDGVVHEVGTLQSTIRADHVVVCAGALASPILLLTSGFGDMNPKIGRALQDHPTVSFTMKRNDSQIGVFDATVYKRSRASTNQEFMMLAYERVSREMQDHALMTVSLLNPTSRGAVTMNGSDVNICMNMLSTDNDIVAMREAVRAMTRVVCSSSFSAKVGEIFIDDTGTQLENILAMSDGDLDTWIRGGLSFVSHASSSCSEAVDKDGNLIGCVNLTVADASVLEHVPSDTPAASVTMEATRIGRSLGGRFA